MDAGLWPMRRRGWRRGVGGPVLSLPPPSRSSSPPGPGQSRKSACESRAARGGAGLRSWRRDRGPAGGERRRVPCEACRQTLPPSPLSGRIGVDLIQTCSASTQRPLLKQPGVKSGGHVLWDLRSQRREAWQSLWPRICPFLWGSRLGCGQV